AESANLGETERLTAQLVQAEVELETQRELHSHVSKVADRDLTRARWGKKLTRTGAVALGGLALANGATAEPLLALAALGGAPIGWWWLARPHEGGHEEAAATATPAAAPEGKVSLVKRPGAPTAETTTVSEDPVPAPGEAFVPAPLADAANVSLVKESAERVRGEMDLINALVKAGIIASADVAATHLAGVIRPVGPGWTATIELPPGMKAETAIKRVAELASALRIKKTRIEMRADTSEDGHEGRFTLWVANEDNPFGTGKRPSELIKADRWDFWEAGIPLGPDARADRQSMHLLWNSLMIGGLMGYGKSYLARLPAAAAALDPTVRVLVITGKTGPDWAPLRHLAHRWIAGATPEVIREVLAVMESLISEMQQRGTDLDRLYEANPEAAPEGKITPALAADGMGPVLLVVDELQELLDGAALIRVPVDDDTDGDGESKGRRPTRSGKDLLVEAFARYVRVTRFVGGMGVFITQRPDSNSVPTQLREVCSKRACYRVKGARSAEMVLGKEAVDAGAAPHLLTEASKGVVVLDQGGDDGHVTLKADTIDLPEFKDICVRGRQLRNEAGTLTGDALDYGKADAEADATRTLLTDVLTVMDAAGIDRARVDRLADLLADHDARYFGLDLEDLRTRLRTAGGLGSPRKIGAVDGQKNANGYRREHIATALEQTGK
ncbi:hypothetical protein, partial [Streptomyces sp. TR06-5]|uniref:hypothetical protein n=1 Tax=Streptomyces sp. TR06-5 TaxID=3385976 RepID=UPI00399FC892